MHSQPSYRNFCIIAHVDHGKSTLADRMLETTGTVTAQKMKAQFLDKLALERERGITIKLQAVRMEYRAEALNSNIETRNKLEDRNSNVAFADSKQLFILNLIDTPGHVDFTYEVTRSLAACEGAILLVDATQGIQAQTLAHTYKAIEQGLTIIPVINKIDLVQARVEEVQHELQEMFGFDEADILPASGKTGQGVQELLAAVIERVPEPKGRVDDLVQALVFDSFYDAHKGVVALVRVFGGEIAKESNAWLMHGQTEFVVQELGFLKENMVPQQRLVAGEVGYIATGIKDISHVQVGDTITLAKDHNQVTPLPGYQPMKPLVFASLFPIDTDDYRHLRDAIEKLSLNDSALTYEPASSQVLGFGFKCGFLGLLHVDIVKERLESELGVEVLVTTPTVEFENGQEQWVSARIITPAEHMGAIIQVCTKYRGFLVHTENLPGLSTHRVLLTFELPLLSIMTDFYDQLKSVSSGYASLEYEVIGYRPADVVKLSILINSQEVDALSFQTVRELATEQGRRMVERLKELIPRQQFKLPIQATIDGKIIARADVSAFRKDVTGKLYGGDRTRKDKLLEKQKKGKKKLKQIGQVSIPAEVFREFVKGGIST